MADEPVLFVTGLGRCGTTMAMQMLNAAGVPCTGTAPAYEDIPVTPSGVDHDWLSRQGGRAVKWIDPTVTKVRHQNGAAIFLSRDPVEQAKSQLKILGMRNDRTARRAMTNSVQRDTRHARAIVTNLFGAYFVLPMHFDKVLRDPAYAADRLAHFCDLLGLPFGAPDDAASVVHKRDAKCAPDLSAELRMISEANQ